MAAGKSAVGPVTLFDASTYNTQIGAEVKGFDAMPYFVDQKMGARLDRYQHFGHAAAKMALDDSGIDVESIADDFGVLIGTYSSIFGELAKAWTQSVTQAATSATTLATKWSKNGLTVQDLIDESTKLGGQFASQPWRYLAAAQQPAPAPPGTGTTTTGGAT